MIVRNLNHPEVKATRYVAHGQGIAHFIMDTRHLRTLMFFAHASVPPGKKLLGHIDPMEEIYYIERGQGRMQVNNDVRDVAPGDAIHIAIGDYHELTNTGQDEMSILVVAGLIPQDED